MVDVVLEDSLIRDLLEDAADPAQRGGLAGSAMRLKAATPVLASVSPLILHERRTCHQLDTIRYCNSGKASPSRLHHIAPERHTCALCGVPASECSLRVGFLGMATQSEGTECPCLAGGRILKAGSRQSGSGPPRQPHEERRA